MRRALVAVLACALLVWLWLERTPSEKEEHSAPTAGEGQTPARTTELAAPPPLEDEPAGGEDGEGTPSARRARQPGPKARPEELRSPVKGRVVVAETGDPIETVLSLRLRTLDLLRSESLVTSSLGTFTSRTPFPRARLLALVKDEEGRELVDHEAPFDPASEEEWSVLVPASSWPTFATGRVVDQRGTPLEEVEVSLVGQRLVGRRAEVPFAQDRTDEGGEFALDGLCAGTFRLHVQGHWSRSEAEVALIAGPNALGDLVLPEPAKDDVVVRLVLEDPETAPDVWIELREAASGRLRRFMVSDAMRAEDGSYTLRLVGIPHGTYELSPHAFDGRLYEPARHSVSPPATVEFRARGRSGAGTIFRARDARTGEPLAGFFVFGRFGRTWGFHEARQRTPVGNRFYYELLEEVRLRPGFDSWVVGDEGYRAKSGSFAGAGATIEVALEPGWSELLQFEDAEGDVTGPPGLGGVQDPPVLAGVEVLVAGQVLGTSDGDGFVLIEAERQPDELEFRLPGWRVVREFYLGDLHTVVMARAP